MRIGEMSRITGATPDQIRYMESMGFITAQRLPLRYRVVRDYAESDVGKVHLIASFLREGVRYEVAYKMALEQSTQPRLF